MTASLNYAKPLLSAAINSGFRESGVQSLKNLDHPEACPMVAVRTAGLGLEAIVASVEGTDVDGSSHIRHLVTKEYSTMLLKIANERFVANKQRIDRFQRCLKEAIVLEAKRVQCFGEWESHEARRERKRDEGLRKKAAKRVAETRGIDFEDLTSSEDGSGYLQVHPSE
jgi:tRNA wybutosine-synthesizing protein 3